MNIRKHNRQAWNKQVDYGNEWTVPVTPEQWRRPGREQ